MLGMSQKPSLRSLNFPSANALRNEQNFRFYMVESGHDLPSPRDDPPKFVSWNRYVLFFGQAAQPGFVSRVKLACDELLNA
jgi:hypothetical protein